MWRIKYLKYSTEMKIALAQLNYTIGDIDGNANRVACLTHGPSHVIMLVGRNKFTASVEASVERVRNVASPANAIRLNRNIPCGLTGSCHDCLSPECFCNQIVITRRSGHAGRIKVFLINEDLGY